MKNWKHIQREPHTHTPSPHSRVNRWNVLSAWSYFNYCFNLIESYELNHYVIIARYKINNWLKKFSNSNINNNCTALFIQIHSIALATIKLPHENYVCVCACICGCFCFVHTLKSLSNLERINNHNEKRRRRTIVAFNAFFISFIH